VLHYTSGHDTSLLYIVTLQAVGPPICLELYWLYQSPRFPGISKIIADELLSDTVNVLWVTEWHSTRFLSYWVTQYTFLEVLIDAVHVLWGTEWHSTRSLKYLVTQYTFFEVLIDTVHVLWGNEWHYAFFAVLSDIKHSLRYWVTLRVLCGTEWHSTRSLPKPYLH
jgi:hypothetical protein